MPATSSLLLKFRVKDTPFGVTLATLKRIAEHDDLSETEAVHWALSRMPKDELPAYDADDGSLTALPFQALRKVAAPSLPQGKVLREESLF